MEGVLLVNKPVGPTSFAVIRQIKKIVGKCKIGHAGTLDPLASGLLVICLGKYTKLISLFSDDNKSYEATFTLGLSTTTDDAEGEILNESNIDHITLNDVLVNIKTFLGEIKQIPPHFSAVKFNGQRAYNLARANKDFSLPAKTIYFYNLIVTEFLKPDIKLLIDCSKGAYVRSLARDLGQKLLVGAYAKQIKRIKSGYFCLENALSFVDLTKENISRNLLVGRKVIGSTPLVSITESEKNKIKLGQKIAFPNIKANKVILVHEDELIAILNQNEAHKTSLRVL